MEVLRHIFGREQQYKVNKADEIKEDKVYQPLNPWGEENPCYYCGAQCCKNVRIPIEGAEEMRRCFGEEWGYFVREGGKIEFIPLEQYNQEKYGPFMGVNEIARSLKEIGKKFKSGVVAFTTGEKNCYAVIVGKCPHLLTSNQCGVYGEERRPHFCNSLVPGESSTGLCNEAFNKMRETQK